MNEQVKNIIVNNNTFLIVSDKLARPEIFLARESLRVALEGNGKKILIYPELPRYFFGKFKAILPPSASSIPFITKISVPRSGKIEEVGYQEDGEYFSVTVTSKHKIEADKILIKEKAPKVEALFLVNFLSDISELSEIAEFPPKDRQIEIIKNHILVSKKIYDISVAISPDVSRNIKFATLLYAALTYETKNFKSFVTEEVFDLARTLLKNGADKEKIGQIVNSEKSISFSHVLGRALARTQIDPLTSSSWTFITKNDFEKSAIKSEEFSPQNLIDSIHEHIPEVKASLVFFEESPGVRCFAHSFDSAIIRRLNRSLGEPANGQYLSSGKFENFTIAEQTLRQLLKD